MLPNSSVVINVLKQIIAAEVTPIAIVDCSTIDINDAREAHALATQAGLGFLDAPVSGGIAGATAGTLTTMVGGDEALLDSIKPVVKSVFKNFVYCGSAGAGQAAKICNNMMLKDMNLTQSAADSTNQTTPLGAHALALYDAYVRDGGGTEDFSGIIR